jgi:uncharacterized membrane-anchored protein YhcB (DUF1043 family)
MNLEEFNIIIFITGIILGCITTLAVKNFMAKSTKKTVSSSDMVTIQSLQQELDKKQVIIDNFFIDSNEKLTFVEKHISSLRNTLADNAKQISNVTIESKSNTTDHETDTSESSTPVAPPRDYALKKDKEPGMLSEQFGLSNKDSELEPKRTI